LYAFLSDAFQRKLHGESPELTVAQRARYETLSQKKFDAKLTEKEEDELYALQAEVDGRDFALQVADYSWKVQMEAAAAKTAQEIGDIAVKLSEIKLKGKRAHARKPRP
jgi:hypothetical protein